MAYACVCLDGMAIINGDLIPHPRSYLNKATRFEIDLPVRRHSRPADRYARPFLVSPTTRCRGCVLLQKQSITLHELVQCQLRFQALSCIESLATKEEGKLYQASLKLDGGYNRKQASKV
jgi:hypothetical protein